MTNKLQVELRQPGQLTAFKNNARLHDQEQIDQIIDSINEFGFTNPLLIDENDGIIAGHGRLEAAKAMELPTVPVIVLSGLSEEQKRAYVLADNKLALNARWDESLLAFELGELATLNFDTQLTGFTELEVAMRVDDGVDDPSKEWVDMPEFQQNSVEAFRTMIVHLPTEEDWNEFVRILALEGFTPATKYVWWPKAEIDSTKDLRMVSNSE